jgi:hypothetical protein
MVKTLQERAFSLIESFPNALKSAIAFTFETWKPISEKNAII